MKASILICLVKKIMVLVKPSNFEHVLYICVALKLSTGSETGHYYENSSILS
jgi:hypothetical protein